MNKYIGTKVIKAKPMTRGEYNKCCCPGWCLISDENPDDPGYMVGYPNSKGEFNGAFEDDCHYVSWSPADVFEASYQLCLPLRA